MNQSPFYNQRRQGSAKKGIAFIITWKLAANYIYLEILVPYLDNLSEKVIVDKKKQRETMKILTEAVRMLQET